MIGTRREWSTCAISAVPRTSSTNMASCRTTSSIIRSPPRRSHFGGPDYSGYASHPYWFGTTRKLLGLPGTGGYVGWLRAGGTPLYEAVTSSGMRRLRAAGAFARLRLIERIRLSPEDYNEPEMRRL